MSILNVIGMIPKGGKFANAVVNRVHNAVKDWKKFKEAITQIDDLLKQGKLKLDGKQKTIFESNKNILKNHEKTLGKKEGVEGLFKKKKEDPFKGWKPSVYENQQNLPPYTKEMEKIDNLLSDINAMRGLSKTEKAALETNLQNRMSTLIDKGRKEFDFSKLSLGEVNKRLHGIQKRIREIADNPNIPGDVYKGPKKDLIAAIYETERPALDVARTKLIKANNLKKYGDKFPRLDPDNNAFIVMGLDESGNPIKVSRFTGKFTATQDKKTGDLTRKEGTSFYDTWDLKKNQMRESGKEIFHETLNREGKVIMSNPNYKLPRGKNMDPSNELYNTSSTSDLAKKGYPLKDIDMIVKGRIAKDYLTKTRNKDHNIAMHEQTPESSIMEVMQDLYTRGDDVYKMTIEQWTNVLPKYFAEGGYVPGYATGGVSNLFRQRQGFQDGTTMDLKYINPAFDTSEGMLSGVGGFPIVPAAVSGIALALSQKDKDKKVPQKKKAPKLPDPKPPFKIGDLIIDFIVANSRPPTPSEELRLKEILRVAKEKALSKDRVATADELEDYIEILDPTGETGVVEEGMTIRQLDKMVADDKAYERYMYNQYKMGKLDPTPGDKSPARKRFLEKKLEDMELSGDKRLMTREEIEELSSFDLGTEMDEAIKKYKQKDIQQKKELSDFDTTGKKGNAAGGLIPGYATGGVANLFRMRK